MRKMVFGALGSLLLIALPALSFAGPITWTYNGTCDWGGCSGQAITGTIIGDPTTYGSSNELNEYLLYGEIDFYSFTVGSYTFSGGSLTAEGTYLLDAVGNIVGGSMTFGDLSNIFALEFLGIGSATWSITKCALIWCQDSAGGTGSYTAHQVPEPGTLALFGLGLLAAGFAARRRRAK